MSPGIAPALLLSQVENTASWALRPPDGESDGDIGAPEWRTVLLNAEQLATRWHEEETRVEYLLFLLAAHFTTVATFVPTDVDTRIRHHAWQELRGTEALAAAVDVVDRASAWDPRSVSERVVTLGDLGAHSGHDGEWLAVRAGALGRALAIRAATLIDRLTTAIDTELEREAIAFASLSRAQGRALDALRLATVIAHNVGDLSRVVADWEVKSDSALTLRARYHRLGHQPSERFGSALVLAGDTNKAIMATENHRFLRLRQARPLRSARALLLPIGPFFDAWGERVGAHPTFESDERGAIITAILEGHASDPSQQGYLRALAGFHRCAPGGLDAVTGDLPARLRKLIAGGAVRESLRLDASRFEARMANRYRAALDAATGA